MCEPKCFKVFQSDSVSSPAKFMCLNSPPFVYFQSLVQNSAPEAANVQQAPATETKPDVATQQSAAAAAKEAEKEAEKEAQQKDASRPISSTAVSGTPWCVVWTGDGRVFFFNPSKRISVWETPEELKGRVDVERLLKKPPGDEKESTTIVSSTLTKKDSIEKSSDMAVSNGISAAAEASKDKIDEEDGNPPAKRPKM